MKNVMTKRLLLSLIMAAFMLNSNAQQNETDAMKDIQKELSFLKRLKLSGYVQAQWQKAAEKGVDSYAGGNFADNVDNRFSVRRGRVKFSYEHNFSKAVMQFDITEKGVGIKDAYLTLSNPWINAISLTGGVFDRPFGYEISYSSSVRESPERSRVFQTLFPKEREVGAKITLKAPLKSRLNAGLDAGLFNGNAIGEDTDSYKDFIGHLYAKDFATNKKFNWGLGFSYYNGGFASAKDTLYTMGNEDVFKVENIGKGDKVKREYFGIDAQLSYKWRLGKTQLRGEFLTGTQPGTSLTTESPSKGAVNTYACSRKFNGYYLYLIHDIFASPFQLVVKYDVYDPNTDVKGNNIGKSLTNGLAANASDVKYSTLGLGINCLLNKNIRLMAYYDIVKNEKSTQLAGFEKDIKDNVFTLRLQYKF